MSARVPAAPFAVPRSTFITHDTPLVLDAEHAPTPAANNTSAVDVTLFMYVDNDTLYAGVDTAQPYRINTITPWVVPREMDGGATPPLPDSDDSDDGGTATGAAMHRPPKPAPQRLTWRVIQNNDPRFLISRSVISPSRQAINMDLRAWGSCIWMRSPRVDDASHEGVSVGVPTPILLVEAARADITIDTSDQTTHTIRGRAATACLDRTQRHTDAYQRALNVSTTRQRLFADTRHFFDNATKNTLLLQTAHGVFYSGTVVVAPPVFERVYADLKTYIPDRLIDIITRYTGITGHIYSRALKRLVNLLRLVDKTHRTTRTKPVIADEADLKAQIDALVGDIKQSLAVLIYTHETTQAAIPPQAPPPPKTAVKQWRHASWEDMEDHIAAHINTWSDTHMRTQAKRRAGRMTGRSTRHRTVGGGSGGGDDDDDDDDDAQFTVLPHHQ